VYRLVWLVGAANIDQGPGRRPRLVRLTTAAVDSGFSSRGVFCR
jgi:hypothetical protein